MNQNLWFFKKLSQKALSVFKIETTIIDLRLSPEARNVWKTRDFLMAPKKL